MPATPIVGGRKGVFSPPEIAIIHSDGSRVALLDREGWEGGVDGYLAKIEKEYKAALVKREAEEKARKAAAKKVPLKTDATSTPAGFTDNLDEALAKAKAEGKLIYACFSGSDWCYWCKKLEKEVLSDPLFVANVMDDYTNWKLATLALATFPHWQHSTGRDLVLGWRGRVAF